jgi:hypothetical protein
MTLKDDARKLAAQSREKAENLEETMLQRAEEALEADRSDGVSAAMRDLAVQQRQEEKHQQETLLSRSQEAIDPPPEPTET